MKKIKAVWNFVLISPFTDALIGFVFPLFLVVVSPFQIDGFAFLKTISLFWLGFWVSIFIQNRSDFKARAARKEGMELGADIFYEAATRSGLMPKHPKGVRPSAWLKDDEISENLSKVSKEVAKSKSSEELLERFKKMSPQQRLEKIEQLRRWVAEPDEKPLN